MKFKIYTLVCISLILCSCATYEPTQFGDNAEISAYSEYDFEGELLFITDSSFFISNVTGEISEIAFKKSEAIKINGYTNRGWLGLIALQAIPPIILSITAQQAAPLALLIIPAISLGLYEMGTPPAPGIDKGQVNKYTSEYLKKYARFPQGLTSEQFKEFSKNKIVKKYIN